MEHPDRRHDRGRPPFVADDAAPKRSAAEFGVLWTPMHHFYGGAAGFHQIRLSFSVLTPEQITEGLDRLVSFAATGPRLDRRTTIERTPSQPHPPRLAARLSPLSTPPTTALSPAVTPSTSCAPYPPNSVRLIVTTPWFQGPYVIDSTDPTAPRFGNWLVTFMEECERALLPDGSVVLELGCTWAADRPVRTIQHHAALSRLVGEHG
ncbi:hypothetical protein ACFXKR_34620 [Streptomyces violascens]|uniref:hypothetical protein n=1 Tax=Streptomyces violascens TaxID=67381 RepID=UPI0036C1EA26